MEIVWIAFSATAIILAAAALAAFRVRKRSHAFRVVGWSLLTMAVGTAVFPTFLPILGVRVWGLTYAGFVLVIASFLTAYTAFGKQSRDEGEA